MKENLIAFMKKMGAITGEVLLLLIFILSFSVVGIIVAQIITTPMVSDMLVAVLTLLGTLAFIYKQTQSIGDDEE